MKVVILKAILWAKYNDNKTHAWGKLSALFGAA